MQHYQLHLYVHVCAVRMCGHVHVCAVRMCGHVVRVCVCVYLHVLACCTDARTDKMEEAAFICWAAVASRSGGTACGCHNNKKGWEGYGRVSRLTDADRKYNTRHSGNVMAHYMCEHILYFGTVGFL